MFLTEDSRDGIYYIVLKVNGKRKRKSLSTRDPVKAKELYSNWDHKAFKDIRKIESETNLSDTLLKAVYDFILNYTKNNYCRNTYKFY
jgi:hypothetical protein